MIARNQINSLYEFIKQRSHRKSRPLKIICDWDDCLQPVKPRAIFLAASPPLSIPFERFFSNFWEGTEMESASVGGKKVTGFSGSEEERKAIEEFEKQRIIRRKNPSLYAESFYSSPERFKTPLTNLAGDLLLALKEDLIKELVIISSFRRSKPEEGVEVKKFLEKEVSMKKKKINETFGNYPQFQLELREIGKINGVNRPHRWEIIKENHSDFDIYIDDNKGQITSTRQKFLGKEKIFVLNDYLANRSVQFPDSYLVKTMLSDITDQDFSLGALECRLKKLDQGIQDFKATNRASSSTPLWLIVFSLISGVLVFISLRIGVWKSKPRK